MSRYYKQLHHGSNEARSKLGDRLAREEMGDAAHDQMVSHHDDRIFKLFGLVFIALFAVAVLIVAWLGY